MSEYAYEVDKCFGITYRVEAPDLDGLEAAAKRMGMSPVVVCGIEPTTPDGERVAPTPSEGQCQKWDAKADYQQLFQRALRYIDASGEFCHTPEAWDERNAILDAAKGIGR